MRPHHQHRAVRERQRPWSGCVFHTEDHAAGPRHTDAAHGNVVYIQTCQCGAKRVVERNQDAVNRTLWRPAVPPHETKP